MSLSKLVIAVKKRFSSRTHGKLRKISDGFQLFAPAMQPAIGAIPVVGGLMKAVIGTLSEILQVIDRNVQNKEDIVNLESQLNKLSYYLDDAPTARDPREQSRRDALARVLQETSHKLENLKVEPLPTSRVTQAISGCSNDINNYLSHYQFSAQMQIQQEVHRLYLDRLSPRTIVIGSVTLLDATAFEHHIPVNFCTSYQQLTKMLGVLFQPNSPVARIQKWYLERGQYDLCIDEGRQVTQLTSHGWSGLQPGMKIIMRIMIEDPDASSLTRRRCTFCETWNESDNDRVSIDCQRCGRRFQASDMRQKMQDINRETVNGNSTTPIEATEAEMHLIRNFHLQYDPDIILCPPPVPWDPVSCSRPRFNHLSTNANDTAASISGSQWQTHDDDDEDGDKSYHIGQDEEYHDDDEGEYGDVDEGEDTDDDDRVTYTHS